MQCNPLHLVTFIQPPTLIKLLCAVLCCVICVWWALVQGNSSNIVLQQQSCTLWGFPLLDLFPAVSQLCMLKLHNNSIIGLLTAWVQKPLCVSSKWFVHCFRVGVYFVLVVNRVMFDDVQAMPMGKLNTKRPTIDCRHCKHFSSLIQSFWAFNYVGCRSSYDLFLKSKPTLPKKTYKHSMGIHPK